MFRRTAPSVLVLFCLGIAACTGAAPISPSAASPTPAGAGQFALGEAFWIGIDQTATLENGSLRLTFADVTEDSRCARDVQCIWAGQVTVQLEAEANGQSGELLLTTPTPGLALGFIGGYQIELLGVEPYPEHAGTGIPRSDYRANLLTTMAVPTLTPSATSPAANVPPLFVSSDEEFRLPIGGTATLKDGSLSLIFADIVQDSRCPLDVECIWAGQATIRLLATLGNMAGEVQLTYLESGQVASRAGLFNLYTVELRGVEPYPQHADQAIDLSEYQADLIITDGVQPDAPAIPVTYAPSPTPQ